MSLLEKRCTPCQGGIDPMSRETAQQYLADVPGWRLSDDASRISRRFKTGNFAEAQAIANSAGDVAEQEDHHPEIRLAGVTARWRFSRMPSADCMKMTSFTPPRSMRPSAISAASRRCARRFSGSAGHR